MNAVVSGRAGIALVFDGEKVGFLRAGDGRGITPCRLESFHFLFGDAGDLQFLEDVDVEAISKRLEEELSKEQCLQFALFLLDKEFSPPTRRHAAEEMEKLLRRRETESFVEGVLYAHPLPQGISYDDALACIPVNATRARKLIGSLWNDQSDIASVYLAWNAVPLRCFGGEAERLRFRAEAVRRGLFRDLVKSRAKVGAVEFSSIPDLDNADAVLEEWLVGLDGREEATSQSHAAVDRANEWTAKARSMADPLEVAIRQQYERVWAGRRMVQRDPASTHELEKELRRLRALQAIEAREIKRGLEAGLSLPIKELNAAVALAEKLLHP